MSTWEALIRVIGAILALALVLLLAWLLLRWMNRRVPGMGGGTGRMIKVLDRFTLGKTTLLLLRVDTKVLLVAISEHVGEKLLEIDDPDGTLEPPTLENPSFSAAFKDAAKKMGFGGKDKGGLE